jgi:hypothetical protein
MKIQKIQKISPAQQTHPEYEIEDQKKCFHASYSCSTSTRWISTALTHDHALEFEKIGFLLKKINSLATRKYYDYDWARMRNETSCLLTVCPRKKITQFK